MHRSNAKIAILDMNAGEPNQGLRGIIEIVKEFNKESDFEVFDVRTKNKLPDNSFDIYISSGGPGSPLEEGPWRVPYLNLVQRIWDHNQTSTEAKKYFFFICYSFQVVCDYFELGTMKLRRSTSFGILPVHKTRAGRKDPLLDGLDDLFYAVDSRDWQLVQPRLKVFKEHGATILSLEKIRTHVELERAIMAVRFSDEFVGTQFHPEADPVGMKAHFTQDENKEIVISNFGEEKFYKMMAQMDDPDKIVKTHATVLPKFISNSLEQLNRQLIS